MKTGSSTTVSWVCPALLALAGTDLAANAASSRADKRFFIENQGQWHGDVLYLCRMGGLDAWITRYGVNYTFLGTEEIPAADGAGRDLSDKFVRKDHILLGHRVLMILQNHNPFPAPEGKQRQEGHHNYFIGNDPGKHAEKVGLYGEAVVKGVYDGIDIRYYFDQGRLRYDYVVHPGSDPAQIVFALEGSDRTYLDSNGNLTFTTRFGEVAMAELRTYQSRDKKEIQSRFVPIGGNWSISLGNYDRSQTLIIDPVVYSTFIGGSGFDWGYGIAVDGGDQVYVTGETTSIDYDITPGAFQMTLEGSSEAFVTKLNETGTVLIYSTYFGGNSFDQGTAIVVDDSGQAYVTGETWSSDFGVTAGAYQTTYGGGSGDAFVVKLNTTGSALVHSTYIGGSGSDRGYGIAVDAGGHPYVAGRTSSTDHGITAGAYQAVHGGGSFDAFVTKLNTGGTALVYSTYIGGSANDEAQDIVVDASGQAYVTGVTGSTDHDITPGAFQTTPGGGTDDAFVTKLNTTGTALVYSTYLGGNMYDAGHGIAVDGSGQAYVTGHTKSLDYDITPWSFQTMMEGSQDVFVTKLNATGSALVYSTYLGGGATDDGQDIAVDGSGQVYVTGNTTSTDLDITPGAFQTTHGGSAYDVFVTKLNTAGSTLLYSTYVGGSGWDRGWGIAIDGGGQAYVTGETNSTNYDITPGTFQTTHGGGTSDAFVTKLNLSVVTGHDTIDPVSWSISPNPSQGTFTIRSAQDGVFELIDITGKALSTFTVNRSSRVVQVDLPSGMYVVREIQSGAMRKLIVE